ERAAREGPQRAVADRAGFVLLGAGRQRGVAGRQPLGGDSLDQRRRERERRTLALQRGSVEARSASEGFRKPEAPPRERRPSLALRASLAGASGFKSRRYLPLAEVISQETGRRSIEGGSGEGNRLRRAGDTDRGGRAARTRRRAGAGR